MPKKDRDEYNAYMRKYMLDRYYRRLAWVTKELGGKCSIAGCEKTDFEIDHIDPKTKSFTVCTRLSSVAIDKLLRELKKCQLLCFEHHVEKTLRDAGRISAREMHGTLSSARYCNCDECRAAERVYNREWRKRRRRMQRLQTPS